MNVSENASTPRPRWASVAVMRRRHLPVLGLAVGLALVMWLAKAQEGQVAATSAPTASWRAPSGWFNPRLIRWLGVPARQDYQLSELRWQAGDDPAWAAPEWNDAGWKTTGYGGVPARAGVMWARFRVRSAEAALPSGLLISGTLAYDVYWDGQRIGHSGRAGSNAAEEQPGPIDNLFGLSHPQTRPGEHVVALRCSTHRIHFPGPRTGFSVFLQDLTERPAAHARRAVWPALSAGAFVLLGLVAASLWLLAARRAALAWFGLACALAGIMQGLATVRWYANPPFSWIYAINLGLDVLIALLGAAMLGVTLTLHRVPRRGLVILATAVAMAAAAWLSPAGKNLQGPWIMLVALSSSCLCAGWAAVAGQRDARFVATGFFVSALLLGLRPYTYVNAEFFLRFLPAVLGVTTALAWQVREQRQRSRQVALRAARLEIELLKKNIQPHFLMNTLTTLLEAVEQNPAVAAQMIQALAGEFRVLSRISGERLIPVAQEIALCEAHLRVISLQRGRHLALETHGLDGGECVPPALFHTLVENGLTHQLIRRPRAVFRLTREIRDGRAVYELTAPGEAEPDETPPAADGRREGTGLRYVKARLEESFPGDWMLEAAVRPDGTWRTCVTIPRVTGRPASEEELRHASAYR